MLCTDFGTGTVLTQSANRSQRRSRPLVPPPGYSLELFEVRSRPRGRASIDGGRTTLVLTCLELDPSVATRVSAVTTTGKITGYNLQSVPSASAFAL